MDILYCIKFIKRDDGTTGWGVFENNWLLKVFDTHKQAKKYLIAWKRTMR